MKMNFICIIVLVSNLFVLSMISGCASTPQQEEKKTPKEIAQLYTELGTGALIRGEFPQAIEDLKKALTANSEDIIAHNHLGLAYYGLGQKELSKKSFETALKIDPKNSDARINLGNLYQENNQYEKAREEFKKSLSNLENKFRHRALTSLGQLSFIENKIDEARTWLYQSVQVNPDYCLTHFLLGSIFSRENNHAKAAEEFSKSVQNTCINNPEGHLQLGMSYLKMKNFEKAKKSLSFLVNEYPQTVQSQKASEELRAIP